MKKYLVVYRKLSDASRAQLEVEAPCEYTASQMIHDTNKDVHFVVSVTEVKNS